MKLAAIILYYIMMKKFTPEEKLKVKQLTAQEKLNFHKPFIEAKSIFGVDIYKYSEYPEDIQVYVPVLFNSMYQLTVDMCLKFEKCFFHSYGANLKEFKNHFISTGDGGFQIFDNPLQSIIFGVYFELNVRRFNSGSYRTTLNKNLHSIINRIELRYCITYDKIYSYDDNFFGSGIINNARILAKDNLNRLLIDQNSVSWFDENFNTIENISIIKKSDILKVGIFNSCDSNHGTRIFEDDESKNKIVAIDILKIGSIKSKNTVLDIYNLKIQVFITYFGAEGTFTKDIDKFLFTIGNLNTQGIQ